MMKTSKNDENIEKGTLDFDSKRIDFVCSGLLLYKACPCVSAIG
jgi:hypothetical protein